MNARTSDRISSLAGKYGTLTGARVKEIVKAGPQATENFAADIRSAMASLRRQDEFKGLRGFIKKVMGNG